MKQVTTGWIHRRRQEETAGRFSYERRGPYNMPSLVLLHPDIPQNLGACLRLTACFAARLHVIEPCGFPMDHTKLRRAGMDYIQHTDLIAHRSWEEFLEHRTSHPGRLMLAETDGATNLYETTFEANDYLLFGSEGRGTPRELYESMHAVFRIPMRDGMRSLNIAMSAGIALAESYRQLRWPLS